MATHNPGLIAETLFVGATRPPMRWGVTYTALLCNVLLTLETFLLTRNLMTLSLCIPLHGICALLCGRDARFFDLLQLWLRTKGSAVIGNYTLWRCSSYSPLVLDLPGRRGLRRARPIAWP